MRYWDKAATEGGGARSAGVLIAKTQPGALLRRRRGLRPVVGLTARTDHARHGASATGARCAIWIEQEPGSGGKESAEASIRNLAGYVVHADRVTGDKVSRARPVGGAVRGR